MLAPASPVARPAAPPCPEWSVRTRLVVLVLSIVLPAALALGLTVLESWRNARARTDGLLVLRVEALSAGIGRELALAQGMLQVIAAAPALAAGNLEEFRRQLDVMPRPPGTRVALSGPDGTMLVNSRLPWGTPLPRRGDLDIVRRVFETGEAQISDLYLGPITQQPVVAIDVPVRGADGRVLYDLNISLPAASLDRVLTGQNLPRTWRAALLDGHGLVVARTHASGTFVRQPATPLTMEAMAAGTSPFDTVSHEGMMARGAFTTVPGTGWRVVVVVPREELTAPLRAGLLAAAATGGGLLLLGLGGAAWQGRRITVAFSALAKGAAALGRGEPPVPPPPGVAEATRVSAEMTAAAAALAGREAERADADRRQAILIAELNHRVKNTLATVQAIAAQTLRKDGRKDGREDAVLFGDLDQRLRALARAHDLLVAGNWADTPLPEVVHAALAPWTVAGRVSLTCLCGPGSPTLRPTQAQALVLALHELATNAAKYGALSVPEGRVTVRCATTAAGGSVNWEERGGPAMTGTLPARRGFGTRLLERALPREMGRGSEVRLDFDPAGLRATILIARPGA